MKVYKYESVQVFFQIILGSFIGITIGMLLDLLIPDVKENENIWKTVGLLTIQVILSGFIVWVVLYIASYYQLFAYHERAGIIGYLILTTCLFISQTNLTARISTIMIGIKSALEKRIEKRIQKMILIAS